mgnify:CR=1 FL=1
MGTYQAHSGMLSCVACDVGKYRNDRASSSPEAAACTLCDLSGVGSYQDKLGQVACTPKRTCPAGQGQSVHGGVWSDRECASCVAVVSGQDPRSANGTWSGADDELSCAPLTVCRENEWESKVPSVSSDRDCSTHLSECPEGQYTFAAPTGTSDRVCRDVLQCDTSTEYETRAPSQSSNRACAACPAGHACDGSATTTQCSAGYAAALGAGSCTQCS